MFQNARQALAVQKIADKASADHYLKLVAEVASETLRYATIIPVQALGDRFDIRGYHDVVLSDGAMPLTVLEAKLDRYIAAKGKQGE